MGRLSGKLAVVTGIGPGNGSAISQTFAREGADLVLVSLHTPAVDETMKVVKAMGRRVTFVEGDVGDQKTWKAAVDAAATIGTVKIVVNNAATATLANVLQVAEDEWDHTQQTNVKSVFHSFRAFIPQMIEQGGGVFVNISSVNGTIANPQMADYAASKSALNALTRNTALDFGSQGIRANCIAPGAIFPDVYVPLLDEDEARSIRDNYPMGRWGHPQNIADAALFLASDESVFITGIVLPVDGGLTIQTPEGAVRKSFRARWRKDVVRIEDV